MQISTPPKSYQPNFGQVNLIQIPKKVFYNPENFRMCSKEFSKAVDKTTGSGFIFGRLMENLLTLLGLGGKRTSKIYTQLESRSYALCESLLNKMGYSLEWLEQNTGTKLKKPLNKDMHSFYLLTNEHKDGMLSYVKVGNTFKLMMPHLKEGVLKHPSDNQMSTLYAAAKVGEKLDKQFEEVIAGSKIHEFKLENLGELKEIADKLGV